MAVLRIPLKTVGATIIPGPSVVGIPSNALNRPFGKPPGKNPIPREEKWTVVAIISIVLGVFLAHSFAEYPQPSFEVRLLGIGPGRPMVGQEVNVYMLVTNTTDISGKHFVEIGFDNRSLGREIYFRARRSKPIFFTFIVENAGKHEVTFENQSIKFTADPYEPPQEGADIEIRSFFASPLGHLVGEEINIEVTLYNRSEFPGIQPVKVRVGDEELSRDILIRGKQVKVAIFTTVKTVPGDYKVEVENLEPPLTVRVSIFG